VSRGQELPIIEQKKKIKRSNLILLAIAGVLTGTIVGSLFSYFFVNNVLTLWPFFGAIGGTLIALFIKVMKHNKNSLK